MTLTKSNYMLFLKHPAWGWLDYHEKSRLPPPDNATQNLFDQGKIFESYGEKLFPEDTWQKKFEIDDISCVVDIFEKHEDGSYNIYEIKASTSVKIEYLYDLAFQVVVLEKLGYKIRSVNVVHVNNEYVRNGEIDIKELCKIEDVTNNVYAILEETKNNIQEALLILSADTCPDISPGFAQLDYTSFKDWLGIYKHLHKDLDKYSIYNLCRLNHSTVADLEREHISLIKDIPDSVKLNPFQRVQRAVTRAGKSFIDTVEIQKFLEKIKYPIYFFDYETLGGVIPDFDGLKPYQQLPFQYSLHMLDKPNGELKHTEYLHDSSSHPGIPLLEKMKKDIGGEGTILVWFDFFEKGRNEELANMFPEYKDFLTDINARITDLMTPFFNLYYAHPDFFGSASIKKVLPALVPELSYKKLNIQEGSSAQKIWMETVLDGKNSENKSQILKDLSDYCTLDTLAMVRIFEKLIETSR